MNSIYYCYYIFIYGLEFLLKIEKESHISENLRILIRHKDKIIRQVYKNKISIKLHTLKLNLYIKQFHN